MSIKNIWQFNDDIKLLKKKNGSIKILDLGCGFGNVFFHFLHEYGIKSYLGIDKRSYDIIKTKESDHNQYNIDFQKKFGHDLNDLLHYNDSSNKLYEYYRFIYDEIISKNIHLINSLLCEDDFNNHYSNKSYFKYGTDIEVFIESIENEKFDIIVMSKILHYKDIKDPKQLIKLAYSLLNENGFLYIQNNQISKPENKRKITSKEIELWTEELFYKLDFGEDGNYSHYLFRKR